MQIKMAAVNLLEQLSKSSDTAGHKDLGGALRYCSMEFRQFVIGEATYNHVPSDDDIINDDESPARNSSNATLRRHKSENGSSLAKSARESCWDGDWQWPQNGGPRCEDDGDVVKDVPHRCHSQTSLMDKTRVQNLQPDAIIDHSSRAPTHPVTCSSYGRPGQIDVASARNVQLTFVKPEAADAQYSMMRLPPSLIPSAPEERDIFGGKVGVYLLKNAGNLKVRFAVLTSEPSFLVAIDREWKLMVLMDDIMCAFLSAGIEHVAAGWPYQWMAVNNSLSVDIPEA